MISQQFEWQYKIYIITTVEQKGKLFKKKAPFVNITIKGAFLTPPNTRISTMKNNKSDGKCDGEEAAAALDRPAAVTHIGLMRQRQAGGSVIVAICKSNDKQRQQE